MQSDKPAIDEVLKGIVRDAVICMAEHLKKIPPLGNETYEVLAGDTKFTEEMENKLNLCLKNENVEECMQNVRKEAFDEMENRENDIIKTVSTKIKQQSNVNLLTQIFVKHKRKDRIGSRKEIKYE